MAASILKGALPNTAAGGRAAEELTVRSDEEYEERAIHLGRGLSAALQEGSNDCRLLEMRRLIYEGRWTSPLFDTRRWVRDLETAYDLAWNRWINAEGGDIWI
jgi:predicted O-linked N-acetylglucosamine transferase (SPINDLY family)